MSLLADLLLILHFAFVLFVVAGFALVLAGASLGWKWIRARSFRLSHLAAIVAVAIESAAGIACPLTTWENALRASRDSRSFIGHWVARMLYYDLPEWVFTVAYLVFALAVAAAWHLIPPRQSRGTRLSSPRHDRHP